MTRRTSIMVPDDVAQILDDLGGPPMAPLLFSLLRDHHRSIETGDLWIGNGPWRGWRLTTGHSASSQQQPVLVRPDGEALGPGDI